MNNLFSTMFGLVFLVPGVIQIQTAVKFFPFIKTKGGLIIFVFSCLGAQFDLLYSMLIIGYMIVNFAKPVSTGFSFSNPWEVILTGYFLISLFAWKMSAAVMSLWFTGRMTEAPLRKLLGIKEEK